MIKRLFDIIVSSIGLLLLGPVIVVVALQIRHKLGSPVLFRQVRPGKDGKPFEMIKFRTMRDVVDENGKPLPEMRPNSANKFFYALASGTPLMINYGGWMHELTKSRGCGLSMWQKPIEQVAWELDQKMHA